MVVDEDDEQSPDELEDADADEVEEQEAALAPDDEDEGEETSLDELLAQRASTRKGVEEVEEEDIMALSSEKDTAAAATLPSKVIPIKDQQEFVCRNCHLVKARSQLADPERMFCRDCA